MLVAWDRQVAGRGEDAFCRVVDFGSCVDSHRFATVFMAAGDQHATVLEQRRCVPLAWRRQAARLCEPSHGRGIELGAAKERIIVTDSASKQHFSIIKKHGRMLAALRGEWARRLKLPRRRVIESSVRKVIAIITAGD